MKKQINIFICGLGLKNSFYQVKEINKKNIERLLLPISIASTWNLPNIHNLYTIINNKFDKMVIPGFPRNLGYFMEMNKNDGIYVSDTTWMNRNIGCFYFPKCALPEQVQMWPKVVGAYRNILLGINFELPTIKLKRKEHHISPVYGKGEEPVIRVISASPRCI